MCSSLFISPGASLGGLCSPFEHLFKALLKAGDSRLTAKACHADKTITFPMFFDPLQQQNQPHFLPIITQRGLESEPNLQIPTESYADQQWQ